MTRRTATVSKIAIFLPLSMTDFLRVRQSVYGPECRRSPDPVRTLPKRDAESGLRLPLV